MKHLLIAITLISSLNVQGQDFFSLTDAFLASHVKQGRVDYRQIKQNPAELNRLIDLISKASEYEGRTEEAFLINAYNLFVIQGLVDAYPTKGPLSIPGFFDQQGFNLRGEKTTLNDLEKISISKTYHDPRLHFALVCGAIGCPELASFAFTPDQLDNQLEKRTLHAINDPQFVRLTAEGLQLSQIFQWYADDFGGKDSVLTFVQKHYNSKVKLGPEYSFYDYDWNLNELK